MTLHDVPSYEMGSDNDIANEEHERFLQDLRTAFPAQAPANAEAHLGAMFEAAHLLADNGDPVARPVSNADAPAAQVSRLPKRRSSRMSDKKHLPIRARALRVFAPVIAALTVLGVMASANALPRSVQHVASTTAGWVGLDLPDAEDDAPDASDATDAEDDSKDESVAPDDNQGDDNSQGEDSTGTSAEDNQGDDDGQGDSTGTSGGDQGDDNQGEDTQDSTEGSNNDNQGENDDNQGDNDNQGESDSSGPGSGSEDNQGDSSGGSQDGDSSGDSGDSGSDSGSGSGD